LPTTRQLARPVNTSAFVGTKPTGDLVTSGLLVICPQSLPALILFTASCRQEAGLAFNPSVEGQRQAVFISSNDTDASATVAAVATQLGFANSEGSTRAAYHFMFWAAGLAGFCFRTWRSSADCSSLEAVQL